MSRKKLRSNRPSNPSDKPTISISDEQLMTSAELMEWLQISERTLARYVANGEIPGRMKFGKTVRYDREAIRQWLQNKLDE